MNPTLPEPTEPEKEQKVQPEAKAAAILAELEKAGITSPEQVEGALKASKEVGRMAQHLGSTRNENEILRNELAQLRQLVERQSGAPSHQADDSVDLATLIENSVRNVYKRDILEPQMKAQQQFHAEMEEVTSDEDYPLVAKAFQEHLYSPAIQGKLIRGETSVVKEYNKTIRAAMRAMLGKAAGSLKDLTKKPDPPHMEPGAKTDPIIPGAGKDFLNNLTAAHQKGSLSSDQLLQAKVNAALFGDPNGPKK